MEFWAKTTGDGKPGISVFRHMVNVGCVAKCIAESSPKLLERFNLQASVVGALGALHDLGKISPGFQRKCESWLEDNDLTKIARNGVWDTSMESDHGKVSHAAIQKFLPMVGVDGNTANYVSTVLGAHHGRLTAPNGRGYRPQGLISDTTSRIDWDAERLANAKAIWESLAENGSLPSLSDDSPSLWWLAGLTSVSDWIGSDERFFSPEREMTSHDVASLAKIALDTVGIHTLVLNRDLDFEDLFGFSPNEMQAKALAAIEGPGVYIIEAPMGMGKTEAALGAAYQLLDRGNATGIYFALPTQATSNRMHLRMNKFLQRITPNLQASKLIHGNSWLMGNDISLNPAATVLKGAASSDARTGRDWFASAKRALIAPFGVGTVDQALLGIVAAKHFFVRHFALAGKIVILDEIHSYDLYTGTLIDKLIETLESLGCTVIVLSATLTGKRRGQIVSRYNDYQNDTDVPYPIITGRTEEHTLEPVAITPPPSRTIRVEFISVRNTTKEAIQLARKGGAVLWICNTIDSAQKQYQGIMEQTQTEFPIGLLHSRFPFWRREQLETQWMERFGKSGGTRCGSILVSTQVVEQSVDLDADLLITELAPTDMLLQRLGRLWRHEREDRPIEVPRMCIVEEADALEQFRRMKPNDIITAFGSKARVYSPYVLLRTLEVWHERSEVMIPSHIRQLLETTYADNENEPDSWQELSLEWFGTDSAKRMLAIRNSNLWQVALEDKEGVQTRINEMPTIPVVLCQKAARHEVIFIDGSKCRFGGDEFRLSTAQAIHKNLVKVPEYYFNCVEPCSIFTDYLYGKQSLGIVAEDGSVQVDGLMGGTRFFYSDELGLAAKTSSKRR